jgi:hypothetical protein
MYMWGSTGNTYSGTFVKGKKSGYGIWKKSDAEKANTYHGEYVDDMKEGCGEFKWATGGHYKGNYLKD